MLIPLLPAVFVLRETFEQQLVTHGPELLSIPLRFAPRPLTQGACVQLLNIALARHLRAGVLDFMNSRTVAIEVSDLPFAIRLTLLQGRLRLSEQTPDVLMRGKLNDLLRMLSEDVDPDTLFFHRRLLIEGDTEIGLALKNCLDALEFTGNAAAIRKLLGWPGSLVEKHQPLL